MHYVPFLVASGIVLGGVVVLDHVAPEYAAPAALILVLGVALVWKDDQGTSAGERAANVFAGALQKLQGATGLAPGSPSAASRGGPAASAPAPAVPSANPGPTI